MRSVAVGCALLVLASATAARAAPLATVTEQSGGSALLARVDPLTLVPRDPTLDLAEYHDSWSYSPGGRRLVLGTSAGGPAEGRGIHIVSVAPLKELGTIRVPIAVEALAWFTPRRIAGALQANTVFVADPVLGRLVMKRVVHAGGECHVHPPAGAAKRRLVLLLGHSIVSVGSDRRVRKARLHGLPDNCSGAAVAVDRRGGRAFVVGAGSAVADVRLRTMRVTARGVSGPPEAPGETSALWLGRHGLIAAAHRTAGGGPRGAELIDTRSWRRRPLDRRAGGIQKAGHELLVFGSHAEGLRAFSLEGRARWRTLRGERVTNVQVAGRFAYAIGRRGLAVVDLRRHRVVHRSRSAPDEIEFLKRR